MISLPYYAGCPLLICNIGRRFNLYIYMFYSFMVFAFINPFAQMSSSELLLITKLSCLDSLQTAYPLIVYLVI